MDNSSTVNFNVSDILPLKETTMECNATNTSSGCDVHGGNQTDHLFDSILQISEITFTSFDVLNVLGNSVLMMLIYKASTKMEVSGYLLMNQGVADAGIGLTWLVLNGIMYTNPHRDILETAILVQRIISGILLCESGLSLSMTVFALHIAICNPFFYKIYQGRKTTSVFIVLSWLLAIGTWTSTLAADDLFARDRDSMFILLNLSGQNVWFAAIPLFVVLILPLAVNIIALIRISSHLRKEVNVPIATTSKRYVRQAKGILIVYITYMLTFFPLFAFPYFGIFIESEILLFITGTILAFLNYVYHVFKLPLFLLAFPTYRRVASRIFCHHLASSSIGHGGKLPQRKYTTAGNTNARPYDDGSQRSVEGARSTQTQVDETIEVKGNTGRVNYAFTSTCSVTPDDTARTNDTDDDVTSITNDDVSSNVTSNRPAAT